MTVDSGKVKKQQSTPPTPITELMKNEVLVLTDNHKFLFITSYTCTSVYIFLQF